MVFVTACVGGRVVARLLGSGCGVRECARECGWARGGFGCVLPSAWRGVLSGT